MQRGEAKILLEQWEGAVEDLKHAIHKDNQVHIKLLEKKCYQWSYLSFIALNFNHFIVETLFTCHNKLIKSTKE